MRVTIINEGRRYALRADGRPYTIHGVCMSPVSPTQTTQLLEALVAAGGNTIRTWETTGIDELLDQAHHHGIAVLVGLGMQQQLAGFDYDDTGAVASQHLRIVADIERLREHPAVFGWLVGNELNLIPDGETANTAVWDSAAELVAHIRRVDSNHPVGATFALTETLEEDIGVACKRAPALDFIGLQAYGGLGVLPDIVAALDPPLPYLITEYGPVGHWEMPATDWGREIEEPSGNKADGIIERLEELEGKSDDGRLLGTFAFLWGQKQERTPTWYGLFTADDRRTATVDELQYRWTGSYPEQRAPRAIGITLDERPAGASVRLAAGQPVHVCVALDSPLIDALEFVWELRHEVEQRSTGGHTERPARRLPIQRIPGHAESPLCLAFHAPQQPGEYRVFVQINDRYNGAATANLPFLVDAGDRL